MNNFKSGFISIIGRTNAGKSTLLNALIDSKISITSKKEQTTRKNIKGIYSDEFSQMIFIDTPGLHKTKNKLDEYMDKSIKKSLEDIDLVLYVIDILDFDIEKEINEIKKIDNINIIIIFNKIDKIPADELNKIKFNIKNKLSCINNIKKIFFISSLRNKNIGDLKREISNNLKPGPKYYDEEQLSDKSEKEIIAEIIRQQCLYKLKDEVPHGIFVKTDSMKYKNKCCHIEANIICEKESHKGIIIGKKGLMLKNIATASRIQIEKFLCKNVNLKIFVSIKENWRNENNNLINFGFDIKKI